MKIYPSKLAVVGFILIFVLVVFKGIPYFAGQRKFSKSFKEISIIDKPQNTKRRRIPQVIGIGNKKCSTGALMHYLCFHPQMVCPRQEVHFFDNDTAYQQGTEFYRSKFPPSAEDQLTFEKSPFYFTSKVVASRIKETYAVEKKSVKLILLLCDPAMRAFSDFNHFLRTHSVSSSFLKRDYKSFDDYVEKELKKFEEFLANNGLEKLKNSENDYYESVIRGRRKFLLKGIYFFHLERWYRLFSKEDILVLDGDQLTSKPWTIMQEVQIFLNISLHITKKSFVINPDTGFYCLMEKMKKQCLGSNKGNTRTRTSDGNVVSKISKSSQNVLNNFYKKFNDRLSKLTGKKFSWMRL